MRLELEKLSSHAVARIYDALHDLKDGELHEICMAILWHRHAIPGGQWYRSMQEIGNPRDPDCGVTGREHSVIRFCRNATGPRDPAHQPALTLNWAYDCQKNDGSWYLRWFRGVRCTCGSEDDHQRAQEHPTALVWPAVVRDDGIRYYRVCVDAVGADDPRHAPDALGMQCLCGRYLRWASVVADGDNSKLMVAQ